MPAYINKQQLRPTINLITNLTTRMLESILLEDIQDALQEGVAISSISVNTAMKTTSLFVLIKKNIGQDNLERSKKLKAERF